MDALIESLFTGSISSRLPAWAVTIGFIMLILKYTGILERWAVFVSSIIAFIRERGKREAEQERIEAEHESMLREAKLNAEFQAKATKQLVNQKAQDQLYSMLERHLEYLQGDLTGKVGKLIESHNSLVQEIVYVRSITMQGKESLSVIHSRLDSLADIIAQIAANYGELKPHLIELFDSSKDVKDTIGELEGAIRLLVEVIKHDG